MSPVWRADEWLVPDVVADPTGRPESEWRPEPADAVERGLALARGLAPVAQGLREDPWRYLATLATLGAEDLTMARAAEPHLDAVAILAQAGDPDLTPVGAGPTSTFGVYAARAPGAALSARPGGGGWCLTGTKAWCSLAGTVSHALVTVEDGEHPGLYAVPLDHPGVRVETGRWVARGLTDVTTGSVTLSDVPAVPVGEGTWYLERPGFAWGGIGVAAVWFGAAAAVAGRLLEAAGRRAPDQVALVHLGTADVLLHGALLALRDAGEAIRGGSADGQEGSLLAARTRAVVADAAERVVALVGHALGPGPLTGDAEHAARVADLTVYLRQHHAERDLARLGELVVRTRDGS